MFNIEPLRKLSRVDYYESVLLFAKGLMDGERNTIANLANVSALLYQTMDDVNWVGFYLMRNKELVLGPFQGKPACIRIQVGVGVCGNAVSQKQTQLVLNVNEFPGHIACDGDTHSEIVVPIKYKGEIVAVLDIDSPILKRFNETDQMNLEQLVNDIEGSCNWEEY